ncbi:MAG: S41 family peptidase [Bacteroidales bacterium]|nr:S41 family peptidase [Bacteroidales bacterium]
MIRKSILPLILMLTGSILSSLQAQNTDNFEIAKNLDIFATLFKEVNSNYVEEVQPGELMKTGIDAMLKSLDPFTVFIPESEVEDYKIITTGQYGGIGALIHKQGEWVVISEPYEGKPSQLAGLLAGDRILEVNGESARGKTTDEVSAILKGQPGTTVNIVVDRQGERLEKVIVRENVKIDNIPYAGMIDEHIAYIKLMGFTQNAGQEVRETFLNLRSNHAIEGVIIDLRGNGGGLLNEAVEVTNIFVDKGQLVVSTKGKITEKNKSYTTTESATDTEIPLIILVNNSSASASEIVAGAVQDLDRGIILGQRTYGKGLVQNVIPLSYNAQAKITVARYYIPSGRCIQAIDYSVRDENGVSAKTPDSLAIPFTTSQGRIVFDQGGIEPDITLEPEKLSQISIALLSDFHVFDYATHFTQTHPTINPPETFTITPEIFNDFIAFLSGRDLKYTTLCEELIEQLKTAAMEESYYADIQAEINLLGEQVIKNKEADLMKHQQEIEQLLGVEIISRYYYQRGKIILSLSHDPEIEEAKKILRNRDTYFAILHASGETEEIQKKN